MKILIIHCAYQYKGGEDTVVEEEVKLLKSEVHKLRYCGFQTVAILFSTFSSFHITGAPIKGPSKNSNVLNQILYTYTTCILPLRPPLFML
jgi:hypothetical protein